MKHTLWGSMSSCLSLLKCIQLYCCTAGFVISLYFQSNYSTLTLAMCSISDNISLVLKPSYWCESAQGAACWLSCTLLCITHLEPCGTLAFFIPEATCGIRNWYQTKLVQYHIGVGACSTHTAFSPIHGISHCDFPLLLHPMANHVHDVTMSRESFD